VRRYADLTTVIGDAARAFAKDVKSGSFPSHEESFTGGRHQGLRRVH
jgi:3-methyl-2-oxobutanoate hydroxymethyltransferase